MIQAKSGLMCLNCGHAETTKPSDTPVVPPAPMVNAPSDAASTTIVSTDDTAATSATATVTTHAETSPSTEAPETDVAPSVSTDETGSTTPALVSPVTEPSLAAPVSDVTPETIPPATVSAETEVASGSEPTPGFEIIPAVTPSETPDVDPALAVEEALKAAGKSVPAPEADVPSTEAVETNASVTVAEPTRGVDDKLAEEVRRDLDEALAAVGTGAATTEAVPAATPREDSGTDTTEAEATVPDLPIKTDDAPTEAVGQLDAVEADDVMTNEAEAADTEVGASALIKSSSNRAQPADKTVDSMAPRGRQKGTLNLKPTQDGLSKLSDAALVDAIGPATTSDGPAESQSVVTDSETSISVPETASATAPVTTFNEVPVATEAVPSVTPPEAPAEEAPVHTIDHEAQRGPSAMQATGPEVSTVSAAEAAIAPAVSLVPSLAEENNDTPAPSGPVAPAAEPDVMPVPEGTDVPDLKAETQVAGPLSSDVPASDSQSQSTVPAVTPAPVVAAGVPVPPVATPLGPVDPAKTPLIAATHPTTSNSKLVIGVVAALLVITAATVGAYVVLGGGGKKTGSTAVDNGQSVAVNPSSPDVLDASVTPEPEVQPTAETRDAQRKTDLAAYVAAVKASSTNGYYPTAVPQVPVTATDPSTGAPYVVSTAAAATTGQIQYHAGGACVGPGVTPGKSSTRFVAFYTVLESSPTPYCIDVQ